MIFPPPQTVQYWALDREASTDHVLSRRRFNTLAFPRNGRTNMGRRIERHAQHRSRQPGNIGSRDTLPVQARTGADDTGQIEEPTVPRSKRRWLQDNFYGGAVN